MNRLKKLLLKYKCIGEPAKAAIWFVVCNVIQKSMYFIMVPFLTRMMTTSEYGQYSVFTSWELIFAVFAGLNLAGNSYNVGMIKNENDQERYTSSIQGLWWAVTAIVGGVVLITHNFWEEITGLQLSLLIAVFVNILATSCVDLWTAKQRFNYKYKGVIALTVSLAVGTIVFSIISVSIAKYKDEAAVWSKVLVLFCISLFIGITNIYKGKKIFYKKYWIQGLKFNLPLVAYYLSLIILSQSDRIMIKSICGTDKAGIYSVANSLSHILLLINTAVNGAFVPWEFRRIKTKEYSLIAPVANALLLLVGLLNLLLIGIAPDILSIMTTSNYHNAIWIIPPIATSTFFAFAYQMFVNVEFYYEKKIHIMIASIGVSVLNVGLNAVFIPCFGFIAAGYTTLASYIAFTLVHYLIMKLLCKKENSKEVIYNSRFILFCSIGMILMMLLFVLLYLCNILVRYFVLILIIIIIVLYIKNNKSILVMFKNKQGDYKHG